MVDRARKTSFLSLPAELRNEIYSLVMIGSYDRYVHPFELFEDEPRLQEPSLLAVNRQIRTEGLSIYYGSSIFHTLDLAQALRLIEKLGPERLKSLKALESWTGVDPGEEGRLGSIKRQLWLSLVIKFGELSMELSEGALRPDGVSVLVVPRKVRDSNKYCKLTEMEGIYVIHHADGRWHLELSNSARVIGSASGTDEVWYDAVERIQ